VGFFSHNLNSEWGPYFFLQSISQRTIARDFVTESYPACPFSTGGAVCVVAAQSASRASLTSPRFVARYGFLVR